MVHGAMQSGVIVANSIRQLRNLPLAYSLVKKRCISFNQSFFIFVYSIFLETTTLQNEIRMEINRTEIQTMCKLLFNFVFFCVKLLKFYVCV